VAATTVAVAACAHRAPIRLVEALDPAFTRIGSLLLLAIVLYLGAAAISATVIGIPVALYLVVRLALSAQCMILHGLGVRGALTASWRSTDGYFLKLIALLVLATLSLLVALTFVGMLGLLEPADRTAEVVTIAALSILQSIVLIPMQAAIVSMLTLFYLNLKATAHDVTAA
jgi:membrane-anchored glycerophosphoryl diester phosphodiesterase (GDPDase)